MKKFNIVLLPLLALFFSATSQAALVAADVTAVASEISGDASLMLTTMLPVVGTVLAMIIGIKLMKRFGNKV